MIYEVTRQMGSIQAVYTVEADDEDGAVEVVEGFIGGEFDGLASVEVLREEW